MKARNSANFETAIIVSRKTELDELVARFATASQARFYLEQAGHNFDNVKHAHDRYYAALSEVRSVIPTSLKTQVLDRTLLPQLTFGDSDIVVVVGQDGLVSNTAKYLDGQPIIGVNPNPALYDGVLLPFSPQSFDKAFVQVLGGQSRISNVTLARTTLADGQELLAFNDFYVGAASHVSSRYVIADGEHTELQSSSGVIVSTGAGSSGWLQSVYAGATGVIEALGGKVSPPPNNGLLNWDDEQLVYAVREPFPSKTTGTSLVYGVITPDSPLRLVSHMGSNGVIFSDGIETDYLSFCHGAEATISIAPQKARLVV